MLPFLIPNERANLGHFDAQVISTAAGALLTGAQVNDLIRSDPEGLKSELLTALQRYLVIILPDQILTIDELDAVCRTLGKLGEMPYLEKIPEHQGLAYVVREAQDSTQFSFGGGWHSDWSFLSHPPEFSMLYSIDLPPVGGDTLFSNQIMAWQNLSKGIKPVLEGATGYHSARNSFSPTSVYARDSDKMSMKITTSYDAYAYVSHPAVIPHESSGSSSLFVNEAYTIGLDIKEWFGQESYAILDFLFRWSRLEEFVLRHHWTPKRLVFWDNRFVNHRSVADYDGYRRELIRATIRA